MEDPNMLSDFKYYTSNTESSGIESFNNTRARYLDKREHWKYYDVRMLCPWMDWNENCHRKVLRERDCKVREYKHNHKHRTHCEEKQNKTYTFRDDIVNEIFPNVKW